MKKIKSVLVVILFIIAGINFVKIKALDQPFPVYGYIKDSSGNPLPAGIEVIIKDLTKSTQIVAYTDENGYYQADLSALPNCEDGDLIEVYCSYGEEENSKSFVLDVSDLSKEISFSLIGSPAIETWKAESITSSSAILKANLTDLGGDSSCYVWFEYGKTTSYGKISTKQKKTSTGVVSITITGLQPDTTYHFRAVVNNSKKTAYGLDKTFKTLATLPQITTNDATNVSYNSATLNAYLNKVGAKSCKVWFVYDITYHDNWEDYAYSTPKITKYSAGTFSYEISGLEVNKTYHFRAVASNVAGIKVGEDKTFTTQIILPSITTLDATNITSSSASLKANLTDLGGANSCEIWFEYGESLSYGYTTDKVVVNKKGVISIEIDDLLPGKTYFYRAVAKNAKGISYGLNKMFKTEAIKAEIETYAVEYAVILRANLTNLGGDKSCIVWFEYWEEGGKINKTENISISQEGMVTYVLSGLKENTTYYYRAVVKNSKGISYGRNLSFKMLSLPLAPSITTGNATASYYNATLYGNITSLGDNNKCYAWFEYWNGKRETTPVIVINQTGEISVEINGLEDGQKYYYRMIAVGENGRICYGEERNFTTLAKENHSPQITLLYPENNSIVGVNTSLQAYIEDIDNDTLEIKFYLNGEEIYSMNAKPGYISIALNLEYGKNYSWYIVASDGKNESISSMQFFKTVEKTIVDFSYEGCFVNEKVYFYDNSTGNITVWIWKFGDGNVSNEKNPIHIYKKAGCYTVNLTVIDEYGNSFSMEKEINVWMRGDANMDGKINSLDITKIKRILQGEEATPPADANGDGIINENDVNEVINKILG